MKKIIITLFVLLIPINVHAGYDYTIKSFKMNNTKIPKYNGDICINVNEPGFSKSELNNYPHISYNGVDSKGRTLGVSALLTKSFIPTGQREEIINVINPSGWNQKSYKDIVNTNYLYNRSHLIAWQLGGIYKKSNLITATNELNKYGMLPIENEIKKYLLTNKNVVYRVTPYYENNNLVSFGVLIEAKSIKDKKINIFKFCYNVEPGISINYLNGESKTTLNDISFKSIKYKNNKIYLEWNKDSNASSYEILYRRLGPGKYTSITSKKDKITLTNIINNKTYQIKIRSVKKLYNKNINSNYSKVYKIKT